MKFIYKLVAKLKRVFWNSYYNSLNFNFKGKDVVIDNNVSFLNPENISLCNNVFIGSHSTVQCITEYNEKHYSPRCVIENNVTFTRRLTVYCAESVTIGANTLVGSDVLITDENHGIAPAGTYRGNDLSTKPVVIGKNVWIGDKAVILPGVTIGDGCIIAASSVVTKSVSEFSMVAGNPAKTIKKFNSLVNQWETL